MTGAWAIGLVACVGVMAAIPELELRVEMGFLVGSLVAVLAMGLATWSRMGRAGDTSIESFIEAIEHEAIEI